MQEMIGEQRMQMAELYHSKGYMLRKQGKYEAAIQEYSRAIALEAGHFKALFNRAFCYDKVIMGLTHCHASMSQCLR